MKKILLAYRFRPDHENGNRASASLATYEEAMAEVRGHLESGDMAILGPVPASAGRVEFHHANHESWHGFMLAWGDEPTAGEVSADDRPTLKVDGVTVRVGEPDEGGGDEMEGKS